MRPYRITTRGGRRVLVLRRPLGQTPGRPPGAGCVSGVTRGDRNDGCGSGAPPIQSIAPRVHRHRTHVRPRRPGGPHVEVKAATVRRHEEVCWPLMFVAVFAAVLLSGCSTGLHISKQGFEVVNTIGRASAEGAALKAEASSGTSAFIEHLDAGDLAGILGKIAPILLALEAPQGKGDFEAAPGATQGRGELDERQRALLAAALIELFVAQADPAPVERVPRVPEEPRGPCGEGGMP